MPDFCIVGAPKCGTTALASYLGAHPAIFMSSIKEPNYFCFDAPRRRVVDSLEMYSSLFEPAAHWKICGEASTSYLFSNEAVPAILDSNPATNIIAMVRNPLEMVVSDHAQKVYNFQENEPDFEKAWRLSPDRAKGQMVSPECRAPRYLDYQSIGRLGEQVKRLMMWVPRRQLHVIVFDDLCSDPGAVCRDALLFLGVRTEPPSSFPVMNARKAHAWLAFARLLKHPRGPARWIKLAAKRAFPAQTRAIGQKLHSLNRRPAERKPLSITLRQEMIAAFKDDISLLGELLNRDLHDWHGADRR
jgi:hypothetical protein